MPNVLAQLPEMQKKVIRLSVASWRERLAKMKDKEDSEFGVDTEQHDELDATAETVLLSLGWRPPEKKNGKPKPVDDTLPIPFGDANDGAAQRVPKVQCNKCARRFAVEADKEDVYRCPDCSAVYQVRADDEGVVHKMLHLETPPDDILGLLTRANHPEMKKLTKKERLTLDTWITEHPNYTTAPEMARRGEAVADPETVGSGNPLRIECSQIAGTECEGFDSTDTPGAALCQRCGQKYAVELVEGKVNVRPWSLDDEIDVAQPSESSDEDEDDYFGHREDDESDDEA